MFLFYLEIESFHLFLIKYFSLKLLTCFIDYISHLIKERPLSFGVSQMLSFHKIKIYDYV